MANSSYDRKAMLAAEQDSLSDSDAGLAEIKSSELRYRRLFESARDGILILDSDLGKITDANPFMSELLGYSHDELLGKELWEIGLLSDKKASEDAFQQLKQNGYIRYEGLPLRSRTGMQREVEFVSNVYDEDMSTVVQCNIRDITDRKAADDKLRESERFAQYALDGLSASMQ